MFPQRLFHLRPHVHSGPGISPRSLAPFERNSGYRRAAIGGRYQRLTFQSRLIPAIYLARCLLKNSRARFIAPSDGRRFVAPVGCLISHPLNAFFIARLTISDNARSKSRKNEGKCDGRADKLDRLTNVRKPARESISAPRSRYTPAINHLYRVNIILPS